jgi:hypothetical protein
VGNHDSVAVARQRILQQPEVQRQHQTVGNHEYGPVARQFLEEPTVQQQHETLGNCDSGPDCQKAYPLSRSKKNNNSALKAIVSVSVPHVFKTF